MKKIFNVMIAVATLVFLLSSCEKETIIGEGPIVTETRTTNNFTGISSSLPGKVYFKIDPVFKVEIKAQRNILDVMRTDVIGEVLRIDFRDNVRARRYDDIVINISAPTADFLRVGGVGDISVTGNLVTNNLGIEISGSGSISVEKAMVADKIDARISGSGNINVVAGASRNEELHISGSGNMDLSNVPAEKGETHISGSGDLKVNLSQTLDANISGSGSVYYRGNPLVTTHISGSGSVRPI